MKEFIIFRNRDKRKNTCGKKFFLKEKSPVKERSRTIRKEEKA